MIKKGIFFALITAVISGFSVFINGFAEKTFPDPYLFTTMKNIIVALMLSSVLIGLIVNRRLRSLSWRQWLLLALIGLIGGSIPFLLFFKGLSLTESTVAAFLHKTLLIWATVGALVFLKEKITWHHLIGFAALLVGIGLLSPWKNLGFGYGEFLALIATLFWSAEAVIIRYLQTKNLPTTYYLLPTSYLILAWGRMFFGSIFMIIFLVVVQTQNFASLQLTTNNIWWLLLTSIFLLGYVTTWYAALKHAPIIVATSILAIGFPITVLLKTIFVTHQLPISTAVGLVLSALAIWLITKFSQRSHKLKLTTR